MRDEIITTLTKRKVIVLKVKIIKDERFKPFQITLPANVKRITGVQVTASAIWEMQGP